MKLLSLGLVFILASACINPQGNLVVSEKIVLNHKTMFNNIKKITVKPGVHRAVFKFSSAKKIKLFIDEKKAIKIRTNNNITIPRNGTKLLTASQLGQNYDLAVSMSTTHNQSDTRREHVSCTYVTYEQHCHRIAHSGDRGRYSDGYRECHSVPVTQYGTQTRVYHVNTINRVFSAEFLLPNSNASVAKFNGNDSDRHEVIEWETSCF